MDVETKWLPIVAVDWLKQELDRAMEDSIKLADRYFNLTRGIKDKSNGMKGLANMIVNMHKKQLERMDLQIVHWLTLELTEQEQQAAAYCLMQILKLYRVQDLLDQAPPANMYQVQ